MDIFKFLEKYKNEYMKNRNLQIDVEEALFSIDSFDKWKESLIKRSKITRKIYLENEELIEKLKEYLNIKLNEDIALAFYNVLLEMYENECDDYPVMKLIIDKILPFYTNTNNYGKLVKIYHMLAFEYYEAFGRTGEAKYIKQACEWYKKVISYKDYYSEIKDSDERIQIFIAYSNLIAPFGQMKDGTKDMVFDYYDQVLEFFNSKLVQDLDGKNEYFIKHIEQIKGDILSVDEGIETATDKVKSRFYDLVDNYPLVEDDLEGNYFRAKCKADLLRGIVSKDSIMEKITNNIESLPLPNYDSDPDDTLLLILNYHINAIDLYDLICSSASDKNKYLDRVLDKLIKVHTQIPYGFYMQMMNNVCQEFYRDLHGILTDYKDKKSLLLKLILVRQPTTYIHSLMVSEIASIIAKEMIEENPEFFIGPLNINSIEDVKNKKEDILSYILNAGLLHDVGKCFIVDIVNRQNRRLSSEEFSLIKTHPSLSLKMIEEDMDFKDYFDIMDGHHKWYNDLGGYPLEFNKKESPDSFYIDLITIADCMDAATDILGRNYTSGKNFDTLYQELVKESGTRYNPKIVKFIGDHKSLYQKLSDLTSDGRANIYFKAYQEILK
jgi:HD-GYP domain-containing protein (c-di-GMP phosphodiesterase class II)